MTTISTSHLAISTYSAGLEIQTASINDVLEMIISCLASTYSL